MTFYSQAGQDAWVVEQLAGEDPSRLYFVDVGAHDGVVHSNTYALEQIGWRGICVEPNPDAYATLTRARPDAWCVNQAAAGHEGAVQMVGDTVVSFDPDLPGSIPCNTLPHFLAAAGAPPVVDYLSLDTEGCELQILMAMDFDRWPVRLMTVEHNLYRDGPAAKDRLFEMLTAAGFERAVEDVVAPGYGPYEDWWVNLSLASPGP